MSFNPNRPVQFRRAPEKVRILATDLKTDDNRPIVIAIMGPSGRETVAIRYADGRIYSGANNPYDLVNVPKKYEVWINFYDDEDGGYDSYSYSSQAIADESADSTRIACVRVEFTDGEGL